MVRGLSATATRYAVEFDARSPYDFLISLALGGGEMDELPAADQRWLREARAGLPADVRAGTFTGDDAHEGLASEVAGIVVAHPEIREAAALVAAVESMAPREIARALLQRTRDESGGALGRDLESALAGDPAAMAAVEAQLGNLVEDRGLVTLRAVLRDPVGTAERLHLALRAWLEPFQSVEPRVREVLLRDLAARQSALGLPPAELIERTTGGIRFLADPSIRRVVLSPSYFARPYNWVIAGQGWRLFCYPVADEALGEHGPWDPPSSTVLLYRALGDQQRLRILRLLADRDMYLTEIAQQMELSKPTVKHHLAQLRAAALVTVTDAGNLTYYTLRRERLDEASAELQRYLS
jgi:DNA-binding transcriptional ArsR family regulator